MKIKYVILIIQLLLAFNMQAQKVFGNLKYHAGQSITLTGFNYLNNKELAKTTVDSIGNFTLVCNTTYKGMAYLQTEDKSSLLLVINENEIKIKGTHLKELDSLVYIAGKENKRFACYTQDLGFRENKLAGWKHLLPLYTSISQKNKNTKIANSIQKEIISLEKEDEIFLNNLTKESYIKWYIPIRKLISDMPASAKKYTNRIPKHLSDFRDIDFNHPYFKTSGILTSLLEGHYWLIENSGMKMDSMYQQMNTSTSYLLQNLSANEKLLNDATNHLFDFLEKRSLFKASEYLAIKALTQNSCTLNDDLAKQLETYRIMKVGNTAPDILFTGKMYQKGLENTKNTKLSDLKHKYTLIVFGSSACPKCATELPKINQYYQKWKIKGVETIFISLDNEEEAFTTFVKDFPWLSFSDFKGWETKAAKDYYVFATPTMFLLDKERKIILRPNSPEHANVWINYKFK